MRARLKKLIPSMFHRRLALIAMASLGVTAVLFAQSIRLTIVEADDRLSLADSRLDRRQYLPTYRGKILDRKGRVLAEDLPSYGVAVDYEVIVGTWQLKQAFRSARAKNRNQWAQMSPEQREAAVAEFEQTFAAQVERIWDAIMRHGQIDRAMLDRRLDEIKREVESRANVVWNLQRQEEQRRLREQIRFGSADKDEQFEPRPIREQRQPHVILPQVSDETAFYFRELATELPGLVTVDDSAKRNYAFSTLDVRLDRSTLPRPIRSREPQVIRLTGVADHILGAMRDEIFEEDVLRRPFRPSEDRIDLGGYRPGDSVGARGIEMVYENSLRGLRGMIHSRMDSDRIDRRDPTPGEDVQLTLDIMLQARIQAILSPEFGLAKVQQWQAGWDVRDGNAVPKPTGLPVGTPLDNAAAVVVDVESGEILAMVSMPTMAMGQAMSAELQRLTVPWVNRCVEAIYPPGSIIKPMILAAAIGERVHSLDQAITCTGHYFPDNDKNWRCWIYRERYHFATHGPLGAAEAMARSCNMYFYTLADRVGIERLSHWLSGFGLGRPLDVGLMYETIDAEGRPRRLGETGGTLPGPNDVARFKRTNSVRLETIMMGIGQGPVTWSPVQAANAYATLARGGMVRDATLLIDDPRGTRIAGRPDVPIADRTLAACLKGLRDSVELDYGTGSHLRFDDNSTDPIITAPGVDVWAKSGTAQAPARKGVFNDDGEVQTISGLDHAWFVGLVGEKGRNRPRYAIAVIVELGGSGGRTAGPVANQIIHALQSEGYLGAPEDSLTMRGGS